MGLRVEREGSGFFEGPLLLLLVVVVVAAVFLIVVVVVVRMMLMLQSFEGKPRPLSSGQGQVRVGRGSWRQSFRWDAKPKFPCRQQTVRAVLVGLAVVGADKRQQ